MDNELSFAYLRKSRDRREVHDPEVLARHRAILCELVTRDGREPEWFEEVRSGESIQSRPEFQRLLARLRTLPDVPRNRIGGYLYVIDADRISRGILTERGQIQDLLVQKGVVICTPQGITDLRNTDQRLLHNVKGALAEWELGKYRERVARTRQLQLRQGQVRFGSVPYGYDWDHKHKRPVPHPDEFPILQAMCREVVRDSIRTLSRRYGVSHSVIQRALSSPTICGYPAQTTEERVTSGGHRTTRYLPRDQWVWPEQPGEYPAAISREEWERLQEVLARRQRGKAGLATEDHWCRDVIRINGQRCRLGTRRVPVYRQQRGRLVVPRELVHTEAAEALGRLFREGGVVPAIRALATGSEGECPDRAALESKREELRRQLVALERKAALLEGERALAVEAAIKEVERELEETKSRLERSRTQAALSDEEAQWLQQVATTIGKDFAGWWRLTSDEERRLLARLLLAEITVTITLEEGEGRRARYGRTIRVSLAAWISPEGEGT